jgi:hypothetical protein
VLARELSQTDRKFRDPTRRAEATCVVEPRVGDRSIMRSTGKEAVQKHLTTPQELFSPQIAAASTA